MKAKRSVIEGLASILLLAFVFGRMGSRMGPENLINTIMKTAYDLVINTVLCLVAITVVVGALSASLVEFGVVRIVELLIVVTYMIGQGRLNPAGGGFYAEALIGVAGAVFGSVVSTRLMQASIRKRFGEEEVVPASEKEAFDEDKVIVKKQESVFIRFLNAILIGGNDIAVFTAMGMRWSGFLSTHTGMMDGLGRRDLIGKAIGSHAVGGLAAGVFARYFHLAFRALGAL